MNVESMAGGTLPGVLHCGQLGQQSLSRFFARYGLELVVGLEDQAIPGTFWGEPEAGLIGNRIFVRPDTPVHSALHEACHWICMDRERRAGLHRDAGGDYAEENAVCYLQLLLADEVPGVGRNRLIADMDTWGYSFRLGSTRAWFERDAEDAREWLQEAGLIDRHRRPTWKVRI